LVKKLRNDFTQKTQQSTYKTLLIITELKLQALCLSMKFLGWVFAKRDATSSRRALWILCNKHFQNWFRLV